MVLPRQPGIQVDPWRFRELSKAALGLRAVCRLHGWDPGCELLEGSFEVDIWQVDVRFSSLVYNRLQNLKHGCRMIDPGILCLELEDCDFPIFWLLLKGSAIRLALHAGGTLLLASCDQGFQKRTCRASEYLGLARQYCRLVQGNLLFGKTKVSGQRERYKPGLL